MCAVFCYQCHHTEAQLLHDAHILMVISLQDLHLDRFCILQLILIIKVLYFWTVLVNDVEVGKHLHEVFG